MKRIQRKRTKGWKMPENTVYVGRPTKWGNPLKLVGDMIYINASWRRKTLDPWVYFKQGTIEDVVKYYDLLLNGEWLGDNEDMRYWNIELNKLPINELKGKDLACCGEGDKEIKYVQHDDPETRTTTINVLPYPPNEPLLREGEVTEGIVSKCI